MDELNQAIRNVLKKINPHYEEGIKSEEDLFAIGILDSFGMISYITELEKKFGIKIPNEELIPQNFWSISASVETVQRLNPGRKE